MSEAAKSVPNEPVTDPVRSPTNDDDWSVMDTLTDRERIFVRHVLLGKEPSEAAQMAGWSGEDGAARLFGRASVKAALEQLAPLFAPVDAKRASRILMPYWFRRIYATAATGSDAQSTGAAKELATMAGVNSTRVEHLHASLADVVAAIEARQKSAKALPSRQVTTVQAREITPEDTDTESVATSDAAIWGDDHSAQDALPPVEGQPAATSVPKKRGGKRGGRTPRAKPEAGVGDPGDPRAANTSIPARRK
jgi:hypothetical protein